MIWNKIDDDNYEVRWFENGEEYGKVLKRNEIIRSFYFSSLLKKLYLFGLFFAIIYFALIIDGIVKKKQHLEIEYHECVLYREDNIFEFFGKTYCENRASYWNVIFFQLNLI